MKPPYTNAGAISIEMTADRAATLTDCEARVIAAEDPAMRCQLGKKFIEKREQPEVPGVNYAFSANVTLFWLKATGATWEKAVANFRSLAAH